MPRTRALHRLNAARVKALKTPGTYEDGGGLRLVVSDTDSKAKRWVMRISRRGKRHELGLGSYPAVSLERARDQAADIRTATKAGKDVKAGRSGSPGKRTFRHAFETYFEIKSPQLTNEKHRALWQSTMERYVFPHIGSLAVAEVTAADILKFLRPL
jgi:hypothetical protein